MKNHYQKFAPILLLLSLLFFQQSKVQACVDPDTTIVIIDVEYDTANAPLITEVVVRLSNLRLMNENPNKVCACALTKWSEMFSNLQYIAFVHAGTDIPYKGFAKFENSMASSMAWDNSTSSGSWSGYISTVVNAGLSADDPVDLIIRASTPSGVEYTLVGDSTLKRKSLQQAIGQESLGTDEWDLTSNDLKNAHRGIQNLASATTINYTAMPSTHFKTLDTAIANNIPASILSPDFANSSIRLYPNPTKGDLHLELDLANTMNLQISLLDLHGRLVYEYAEKEFNAGKTHLELSEEVAELTKGNYFLKIKSKNGSMVKQIILN